MRTLLAFLLILPLWVSAQTNVLTGTVGNYGLVPQAGVSVKLTLVSPNPRVVDGIMVQRNPVTTTSSTNGEFFFTNIIWGKYTLSVGTSPTEWTVNVGTNTTGEVPIGSLANSTTPAPPNPATNYYTQAQVDALVAGIESGAGGITNGQESVSLPMLVSTNASLRLSGGGFWAELFPTGDGFNVRSLLPGAAGVSLTVGDTSGVTNNLFAGSDWDVSRVETILVGNADTGQSVAVTLDTNGVIATTGDFHFTDSQSFASGLNVTGSIVGDLGATTNNLKAWVSAESYEPTNIVVDANGVIQTAGVRWPDGYSGLLTNTQTNATWLTVDAFTVTHSGTGWTVVQSAVSRGPLGVVTNKPALTIQ